MARIAVFSDTHGSVKNLDCFTESLGRLDAVFHLGDCERDARIISDRLGTGFSAVRGNCDPYSDTPLEKVIEWHGHRILMLHGHTLSGKLAMYYEAVSGECDCVLYGHTHIASAERYRDVLMVNPGSLSLPRGGQAPSCAILVVTPEEIRAELLFRP